MQRYFVKTNESGASGEMSLKPWGFALDGRTYNNNKNVKIKEDKKISLHKNKLYSKGCICNTLGSSVLLFIVFSP